MKSKTSRYAGTTPAIAPDGKQWLPNRPRVPKKEYRDNTIYTAIEGEDCYLLAWLYLEREDFAWVIADMNNIFNMLKPFEGGERITIPSIQTLYSDILPAVKKQ